MRNTRGPLLVLSCVASLLALSSVLGANSIEAVKGRHYQLTRRHGPWMIMVASFNKPPQECRTEGMTPEEAAQELVYELRLQGIPAYTFQQEEVERQIKTISRRTQEERAAKVRSWTGGICVLAGNYPSSNDRVAQWTLKKIKNFQPQFLKDVAAQGVAADGDTIKRAKSGGIFRTTRSRPGPLSGAFMTTNPLLNEEDLALRTRDPLILQLNSGSEYSLLQNKGKYTVVVATFQGKSQTVLASDAAAKKLEVGSALDDAAKRAWELCTALRRAKSFGYDREFESYVYHDHFSSIVTVGSFRSKEDPRITEIQNRFGAKVAAIKEDGSPTIGPEIFAVPKEPDPKQQVKRWIFDPYPQVIDVPK